ncbi:TlpA family protein disulfide reductase [Flaviaesturariibacter terrae]
MLRAILFFLFLLPATALVAQRNRLRIEGSVTDVPGLRSVQLMTANGIVLAGPTPITDGEWSLSYLVAHPQLALISFLSDVPLNGSTDTPVYRYNVPLFLAPAQVRVETNGDLARTRISGSEANNDYLALMAAAAPYEQAIQRWRERSADSAIIDDLPRQVYIGRKIDSLTDLFREKVYGHFLQQRISSPLTPLLLNAYWHLDGDPDRMLQFIVNLPAAYRTVHVKNFRIELENLSRVWVGAAAPDFSLRDSADRNVSLASLRGQYVLIDFWGSWCEPCRMEAPNLAEAGHYFASRGLRLLGVGIERERDKWLQALREDSIPGTHVFDYRFWDSPVLKKYAVSSLPQNVLVDPEGKIIARNLRGERLWAVLDRLLPR